jgi:S-DNA-T family DNA segregation ATPase FtsK/SpoIIIE
MSAPEHDTPRRARAYLVTDDDVARTVAQYAASRPALDQVSRSAARQADPDDARPAPWYLTDPHGDTGETTDTPGTATLEDTLWAALCGAPDDGADVTELIRMTGMRRSTVYKYLAQLAEQGRAIQVGWGRWRASNPGDDHGE